MKTNPYEAPKTDPVPPKQTWEEYKEMILNHPNSGPLAKISVKYPKLFWITFLIGAIGAVIAFERFVFLKL